MKLWRRAQMTVVFMATTGLIFPQATVWAQQSATQDGSRTLDIELTADGCLNGQIVNPQGESAPNTSIVLRQGGEIVAQTTSNPEGQFRLTPLRGGPYNATIAENTATQSSANLRLWKHQTAPPTSLESVLFVTGDVERAQGCTIESCGGECGGTCDACCGKGGVLGILMNPFVIGAAVASAIAIPLALNNNDDDDDAS